MEIEDLKNKEDYIHVRGGKYTSVVLHPFAAVGLFAAGYSEAAKRLDAVEARKFREILDAADSTATTSNFLSNVYSIKTFEALVIIAIFALAIVFGWSTSTILGIVITGKIAAMVLTGVGSYSAKLARRIKMEELLEFVKSHRVDAHDKGNA